MSERITALEETIAHLARTVEEISEVVARQDREIEAMQRRVQMLVQREAEREADTAGTVPLADERPPHW